MNQTQIGLTFAHLTRRPYLKTEKPTIITRPTPPEQSYVMCLRHILAQQKRKNKYRKYSNSNLHPRPSQASKYRVNGIDTPQKCPQRHLHDTFLQSTFRPPPQTSYLASLTHKLNFTNCSTIQTLCILISNKKGHSASHTESTPRH